MGLRGLLIEDNGFRGGSIRAGIPEHVHAVTHRPQIDRLRVHAWRRKAGVDAGNLPAKHVEQVHLNRARSPD